MKKISIEINGNEFKNAASVSFGVAFSSPITSVSMETHRKDSKSVFIGDIIEIFDSGESVFKGVLEKQTEIDSNNNTKTSFSGRNILAALLDSDVRPIKYLSKNISQIINESLDQIAPGMYTLIIQEDKVMRRYNISAGKSALEVITDLSSEFGYFVWVIGSKIYIGDPSFNIEDTDIFNFDKGSIGEMIVSRDISNAANEVVVESSYGGGTSYDQGLFTKRTKSVSGLSNFLSIFGLSSGGGKSFREFTKSDFSATFSSGAYKVLGSTREAPAGGMAMNRTKYIKTQNDSALSAEDQFRLYLEKYYPKFSIKLKLPYFYVPQVNTNIKIINSRVDIDGSFLVRSFSVSANATGEQSTTIDLGLPAHI